MQTFASKTEFLDAVSGQWVGLPSELSAALEAGVGEGETAVREARPGAEAGLELRLKGWVLRTEDIPVVEAIGIVGTALGAVLVPGGIAAAAVITAVSGFAALCWKAWRKGAPLSKDEIAVLGLLQVLGPMELGELQEKAVERIVGLSADGAVRALQSLTDVMLRDGQVVELVRQDASGRWRATSV